MKTLKEKLNHYDEIQEKYKHQIKVGANGDAFCFDMSLQNTHGLDQEENSKLTFEYESDELSEWLQKIADMLDIKDNDEFDLKAIENRIKEIGEPK